jgi:hypothetical protein
MKPETLANFQVLLGSATRAGSRITADGATTSSREDTPSSAEHPDSSISPPPLKE